LNEQNHTPTVAPTISPTDINSLDQKIHAPKSEKPTQQPNNNNTLISGTGEVLYQDLEGGVYTIIGEDGVQYLPSSLPSELKVNGTKVSYSSRQLHDTISMYMVGKPVEIISISLLSPAGTGNRSEPLIEFEKAGGVTGSYELLRIFADQHGEVTKWNQISSVNLTDDEIENVRKTCNKTDFLSIKSQMAQSNQVPDAISYTIRYQNFTIKSNGGEEPEPLKLVISLLNSLLEKHTISPITANKTLEGSAWRLSSYSRSDGISTPVPNNTQVSAIFGKDRIITGSSGCNTYSGLYNLNGTNLSFSQVIVTRMACLDPGTLETENSYLKLLEQVRVVSGQEKKLTMTNANNTTLLVFNQMKG
ncbi:MAG: META domain-containing protein, partial [Methanospirillum sp.]|uniref:META domain-containing protein n=1 Tax=Methanospirillum sp. TaxID=45200 RepID=UPI00236B3262